MVRIMRKKNRIQSLKDWNKEMELTMKNHYKNGKPYYAETLQD